MTAELVRVPVPGSRRNVVVTAGVVDAWLTREEVAERLRLTVSTLATWASQGSGPKYTRIGKYARYRLADVQAWEDAQLTGGAQ